MSQLSEVEVVAMMSVGVAVTVNDVKNMWEGVVFMLPHCFYGKSAWLDTSWIEEWR